MADSIAAHIIPTAVRLEKDEVVVTATLALRPLVGQQPDANLAQWPRWVDGLFGRDAVTVTVRKPGGVETDAQRVTSLLRSRCIRSPLGPQAIGWITTLWQQLFQDGPGGSFDGLRSALGLPGMKDFAGVTRGTSDDPLRKTVPDVLVVPRNDISHLITIDRARRIADTVAAKGRLPARECFDSGQGAWFRRPWARAATPLESLAMTASGTAPWGGSAAVLLAADGPGAAGLDYDPFRYKPDGDLSGGLRDLKRELKEQREKLDWRLKQQLEKLRQNTDKVAKASRDARASAGHGLKALKEARASSGLGLAGSAAEQDLQAALDARLAVHVAATQEDYGAAPDELAEGQHCVSHRWFAVQGLPALQRLLHLAIDVEIAWSALAFRGAVGNLPDGTPCYAELGVRVADGPAIYTLAKVTLPTSAGALGDCWPTTLEERLEVETNPPARPDELRQRATIDQFDGIVDLEAAVGREKGQLARFDVDSLDVIAASEAEVNRQRAMAHVHGNINGPAGVSYGAAVTDAEESACADRKLRTAGLRIVDQWRDSVVIKEFTHAYDRMTVHGGALEGLVLDADDLTVGFKLDVAVIDKPGAARRWASLTDRKVAYSVPESLSAALRLPPGVTLDGLVDAVIGGQTLQDKRALRQMLDGVALNMPTRLLQNRHDQTAFSEPILATWEGDPLSLECRASLVDDNECNLPLRLAFDLETAGATRPHRLRFGAAIWFGARTVLMAGMSRTVQRASQYYEHGLGLGQDGMALPASTAQVRRHLRFEWIDPPMVATPWADISTEFTQRDGLDGYSMVVRSNPATKDRDAEDERRFGPSRTRRVLFAPAVDLTFANLHGVFDTPAFEGVITPPNGMRGIAYDIERGGFPSFVPGSPVAEASIVHAARDVTGKPMPSGLAVYRLAPYGSSGYFPDPAARHLVIAIRKGGPKGPYLEGKPIVLGLYPNHSCPDEPATPGYPHAVPVVVTVTTHVPKGDDESLTYAGLLKRTGRASWERSVGLDLAPSGSATAQAIEVELRLAPGEDLELEAWCVPDLPHLAAWFDAPESIALLAAARPVMSAPASQEAVAKVRKLLGWSEPAPGLKEAGFVIRRSEMMVEASAVREAAHLLHAALMRHPVPGLAAVRRIRAVHAVEKPTQAPAVVRVESWPLRLRRVADEDAREQILRTGNWKEWRRSDQAEAGSELVVGGTVSLDPHIVETLELRFAAAAPRGRPIDDPQLGRTREDRMRGSWSAKPEHSLEDPSARLYGFHVFSDGRVRLPREEIIFARWRLDPDEGGGSASVDLLDLAKRKLDQGWESQDRFFADGTARRVIAHVTGTARTAKLIPERTIYPGVTEQRLDERRRHAARMISSGKGDSVPETVETVLRATVRPAAVPPKSLLPAFLWQPTKRENGRVREYERRTRIRVRVDRPWFTSGEDERLGIVLWPPNILQAKSTTTLPPPDSEWAEVSLAQGRIARAEPLDEKMDLIDLVGQNAGSQPDESYKTWRQPWFTDEDLGPGGAYVTRWGADPIHESGNVSWFLHVGAFTDVSDWRTTAIDSIASEDGDSGALWPEKDRFKACLVENVLMPIPEAERKAEAGDPKQAKNRDVNFMLVSLLTYAPRFDVDMEQWYVDVEIDPGVAPDPFVRLGLVRFQPHANRRLQVSYPVSEWVQVTGFRRRVSLEVDEGARIASVHVDVPRLASYEKEAPRTVLRATLIERRKTDLGAVVERVARNPNAEGTAFEPYEIVQQAEPVASDSWIAKFVLPAATPNGEEASYAVLVEEIYVMPRASFDSEPHSKVPDPDNGISDTSLWQESGPRFAVRLEV